MTFSAKKGDGNDLNTSDSVACPVCSRRFEQELIEEHVNKCLFLNTDAIAEQSQLKRCGAHLKSPISEQKRIKLGSTSGSASVRSKVWL